MHWLRVIGILLITAVLQGTVLPALAVRGVRPDLLFLVAVCIVIREPAAGRWRWSAFWVGWLAGLLVGVYTPDAVLPLGTTGLVYGLVALVMNRLGEELFLDSAVAQVLVLFPACLAAQGATGLALVAATGGPAGLFLGGVLWTACYSALVAPLVFAAVRRVERFLGVRSRRSFGRA